MQKIDAVVVDDEINNAKLLVHFLKKYCPLINIVGSSSTKEEALILIEATKPQVIFLDIILDEGTGFDLLEEITLEHLKVIFVTAYNEYATKAFKYNAIDYILKPVEIAELVLAVNKVYEDINKELYTSTEQVNSLHKALNSPVGINFIAVPSINKIDFVKTEDIIYLKSDGRYTIFFLSNKTKIVASKNLGEFENILDKSHFFRIHNSYIVNLKHVLFINKTDGSYCKMDNNDSLPIAKRRQESLHRFLKIK